MPEQPEIAVIGAGPFGLSVAAHLGARARVFGAPMETWRTRMPPEMLLRSAWEETSLSAGLDTERRLYELAMATEDRVEGMRAFLEKRKPEYRGR